GAPKCLRASGCTSRSSHLASAATISQVTVGGGTRVICGLRPTLIKRMGTGVPHSVPSRKGIPVTVTTSRPLSSTAQRASACSTSWRDQAPGSAGPAEPPAWLPSGPPPGPLSSTVRGQSGPRRGGASGADPGVAGPAMPGLMFCANAADAVTAQNDAADAQPLTVLQGCPPCPSRTD